MAIVVVLLLISDCYQSSGSGSDDSDSAPNTAMTDGDGDGDSDNNFEHPNPCEFAHRTCADMCQLGIRIKNLVVVRGDGLILLTISN
ncbi:MAG: hypothetical protein JXX29_22675 [Deltaproteobacteria bacterium]|nr:hypothetical protein [Deltaproteobacteria bacterium]MBN2674503.1 hypothetical protein [Deltaproteobacteria bacterium]